MSFAVKRFFVAGVLFLFAVLVCVGCGKLSENSIQPQDSEVSASALIKPKGVALVNFGLGSLRAYGTDTSTLEYRTVSGYVYDYYDGTPIAGATVFSSIEVSTKTDSKGYYKLNNVPQNDAVITVLSPLNSYSRPTHYSLSILTSAPNIDFKLLRSDFNSVPSVSGNLKMNVVDQNNNPLSLVICQPRTPQSYYGYFPTDVNGNAPLASVSVLPVNSNKVNVASGKKGVGGAYKTNISISQGVTTEVALQIKTQKKYSGTVSSGYQINYVYVLLDNMGICFSAFPSLLSQSVNGAYSDLLVPPLESNDDKLYLMAAGANSGEAQPTFGYHFDSVNPVSDLLITQNFSIPSAPSNISVLTKDKMGQYYVTIKWTAPSQWAPSYYLVDYGTGFALTKSNSITIPYQYLPQDILFNSAKVWAMNSNVKVDLNRVELSAVFVDKASSVKLRK